MNFGVQCKTIKLSGKKKKEKHRRKSTGPEPGREFLDLMWKVKSIKGKIDKLDGSH